jgi:disulfide bond formation protein DsbB
MRIRLLVGALAMLAVLVGAAPADATTAKTLLPASLQEVLEPSGTLVATLHGETVVQSQPYCEQKQKIELFRDG